MDYQNGKIYKITNCIDDKIYIGSTCQSLTKRFSYHKRDCKIKHLKVYQHMNSLGIDKFCISLIEDYPCTNKTELCRREGELIKEQHATLNSDIAGRTRKEWYDDNRDIVTEKVRIYQKTNKDVILKRNQVYCEKNKEYVIQYKKTNYLQNKEKVLEKYHNNKEYLNTKIECDLCKCMITRQNIAGHKKTKKCLKLSSQPIDISG